MKTCLTEIFHSKRITTISPPKKSSNKKQILTNKAHQINSFDIFFNDFPGNGHMEGPDFLSIGFDLPRREEEAIPAPCPVSQLHGEAVLDAELP